MPAFSKLQRAGFAGIQFPISSLEVRGGLRDHVHEYPHAPGGAPEKLGRKLYSIRMVGNFQATFRSYPNLWPLSLSKLRALFELQVTDDLVIPTIGTIKAYCHDWSQVATSAILSGEVATFEFYEDQSSLFLVDRLITTQAANLQTQLARMDAAAVLADFSKSPRTGLFDAISNAVNGVLAFKDTNDALGDLLVAKVLATADLCAQADRLPMMNDPRNSKLADALHDLWDTLQSQAQNIINKQSPVRIYTVPSTMAVSDVSRAIYGDTTHAVELMQLNALEDALAIPAGTKVRYYEPQSVAA